MPTLTKIPVWLQVYNKDICWKMSDSERNIYLTFDDGPNPTITPLVLNVLEKYQIKATFFCIGKNVEQYPETFTRILMEGHTIGNHSYSHRNGWKVSVDEYVTDVNKASEYIQSKLFRPPYGRITPFQYKVLKKNYKIVMWDVLSKDYDGNISDDEVIKNVTENISPGSIVVMHDNEKTAFRMGEILPSIITELKEKNWGFKKL